MSNNGKKRRCCPVWINKIRHLSLVNRYQTEVLYLLFLIIEGIFQTLDGHGGAHGMVHEIYGLHCSGRCLSIDPLAGFLLQEVPISVGVSGPV